MFPVGANERRNILDDIDKRTTTSEQNTDHPLSGTLISFNTLPLYANDIKNKLFYTLCRSFETNFSVIYPFNKPRAKLVMILQPSGYTSTVSLALSPVKNDHELVGRGHEKPYRLHTSLNFPRIRERGLPDGVREALRENVPEGLRIYSIDIIVEPYYQFLISDEGSSAASYTQDYPSEGNFTTSPNYFNISEYPVCSSVTSSNKAGEFSYKIKVVYEHDYQMKSPYLPDIS